MDDRLETLDALGLRFGTDKASSHHDYLSFYERIFEKRRDEKIRLLEIGVLGGASLNTWETYFPFATIVGADINPAMSRFARPRVSIEILDQSNIEDLVRLGVKHGPFDIIIEDGSHKWEHQITSLRTLFPFLRAGGYYVVEDLQTNYGSMVEDYRGVASMSCMEYLKRLVDLRVADNQTDISQEEDAFLRTYGRAAHTITFYRRACLIEKSRTATGTGPRVGRPFIEVAGDPGFVALSLLAHVGNEGDRRSDAGWVRSVEPGRNIQGFALQRPNQPEADLQYRARLANGNWTDWARPSDFVGTRGKRQDLSGFSVRLGDEWGRKYALEMVGEFRGETGSVHVRGNGDCIPKQGTSAMFGMQVMLKPGPGRE